MIFTLTRRALVALVATLLLTATFAAGAFTARAGDAPENVHDAAPEAAQRAAAGDLGVELNYVKLDQPCRVIDTRGGGGALVQNQVRSFVVSGTTGFGSQGGESGGCDIPEYAVAVDAAVTAVDPTGAGVMRFFAFDIPTPAVPNATLLNYSTALNATNSAQIPLCDRDTSTCDEDVFVKNFAATSQLVMDVTGYHVKPMFAHVDAGDSNVGDGTITRGSRAVSLIDLGNFYLVTFDRDVEQCSYSGIAGNSVSGASEAIVHITPNGTTDLAVTVTDFDGADDRTSDFYVQVFC